MKRPALFSLPEPLGDRARRTFAFDCLRQFLNGITDTGPRTFFLLVAVQHFAAGDLAKTLIAIPASTGMTLSVILIPFLHRMRLSETAWLAAARLLSAAAFFMAAWRPSLEGYAFWVFVGGMPSSIVNPLLTSVYHENYPARMRSRLFAWGSMVNMGAVGLFSFLIGRGLGAHSDHYRAMLAGFGAASLLSAFAVSRMPSHARAPESNRSFLHAFAWIRKDRTFAYMLAVWFTFGFANFLVSPLKVLYLTEPRYGLMYPAATVAVIVGVIPEAMRMASTAVWAWLFDLRNFISVRMTLNLILLCSIAAFFFGRRLGWLYLASALDGLFSGGANIAWALWVTQVAPRGRTSEYMAVNQFFTGFRGIVAMWLGIRLTSVYGMRAVAAGALALVAASVVMMIPARRDPQWARGDAGPGSADGR